MPFSLTTLKSGRLGSSGGFWARWSGCRSRRNVSLTLPRLLCSPIDPGACHPPIPPQVTLAGWAFEIPSISNGALCVVLADASTTGKSILQKNTDEAFESGAFGLPWMVATNGSSGRVEAFWGVDHIGQVLQFLGIEKPVQPGWRAVL
jgi:hypothetical protein